MLLNNIDKLIQESSHLLDTIHDYVKVTDKNLPDIKRIAYDYQEAYKRSYHGSPLEYGINKAKEYIPKIPKFINSLHDNKDINGVPHSVNLHNTKPHLDNTYHNAKTHVDNIIRRKTSNVVG